MTKTIKPQPNGLKKYTVIKMTCENCGEDVYYVFACSHCGEYLSFGEATLLNKDELKKLIEEDGKEVRGDIKPIVASGGDFEDEAEDVGSLEVDEVDDLYSGPFNPL